MLTPVDRYAALRSLEHGLSAAIAKAAEEVRAFRALTRSKAFTSDHGEVEFRRNDPKIRINPAKLLAWAEQNRADAIEAEHTVTVPAALKPWLVKEMDARLEIVDVNGEPRVVDVTTGELVDFATVEPGRPETVAFKQSADQKAAAVELVAERVDALTTALAPEVAA